MHEPVRYGEKESKRYIIGGNLEYSLFGGFSVEAGFLYRRNGGTRSSLFTNIAAVQGLLRIDDQFRMDVFDVPILGKYYFRRDQKWQPFFATGYSFRKTFTDVEARIDREIDGQLNSSRSKYSNWQPLDIGATFGAGVRWRAGRISLLPEIRYTRWGTSPQGSLKKDQADFLFGIRF